MFTYVALSIVVETVSLLRFVLLSTFAPSYCLPSKLDHELGARDVNVSMGKDCHGFIEILLWLRA